MEVRGFFDKETFTITYVAFDPATKDAVIIDPVLDYDSKSSTYTTQSVAKVVEFVKGAKLTPHYVLETHAHADHLSGSQIFKQWFPKIKVAINEKILVVQNKFKDVFQIGDWFQPDGSQFDQLLKMEAEFSAGSLKFKTLPTPGHTPACSSFLGQGSVFTGDALFMPDFGTGRTDFPLGSAEELFDSIKNKLYTLPEETRVFVGHDYLPGGREVAWESTIGQEKRQNIHLNAETVRESYVQFRTHRDKELSAPKLLLPSVQVNINAGHMPPPEKNGLSYLKIPIQKGE
ncbi:MAG: MBL fold metallo-hydrolase [Bdellovibrionales bacterium]|nr:MBL fold metallo-hydrolase [Bdellovibrionales bacterium]